jgi:hypothetical protein
MSGMLYSPFSISCLKNLSNLVNRLSALFRWPVIALSCLTGSTGSTGKTTNRFLNALSQVKYQGQEKPFIGEQSLWYKCDKPDLVLAMVLTGKLFMP